MTKDFALKVNILGYWGAFPQPGGATSGVLITTSEGKFLIDIGSGVLAKYFEMGDLSDNFKGVLLSHLHFDHTSDIGCLNYAINYATRVGIRKNKLMVYAPGTPTVMWNAIQYPYSDTRVLEDGMELEIAGAKVKVKKVSHTIECYAFRIEREGRSMVFCTDTSYNESHIDFIRGADLLLCEATNTLGSQHSIGKGHMSDIEAGRTAEAAGVGKLCLYHLPSDGDIPFMRSQAGSQYGGEVVTPDICSEFIL